LVGFSENGWFAAIDRIKSSIDLPENWLEHSGCQQSSQDPGNSSSLAQGHHQAGK
jgi:hypothetical protein